MKFAFVLYKYFPYGGLARDLLSIATVCINKGHTVSVYAMEWHGEDVPSIDKHILGVTGFSNHAKVAGFHKRLNKEIQNKQYDAVIGFNKIPDVDVYYAADPCYIDRFKDKSFLRKLNPRYRFFASVERAVFGPNSDTVCLMISDVQARLFKKHYHTPANRLVMLPPGIDISRRRPADAEYRRKCLRNQLNLLEDDLVVLMVGTGFKTKGVDRALSSISALSVQLKKKAHLIIVGEDNIVAYQHMASEMKISSHVHFMGGRNDVPDFLLMADLLLHPARKDNTGTVILEAMVAGLPVLVTDVCGYAKYVTDADAGVVLPSPFSQRQLDKELAEMLVSSKKEGWKKNALAFAETADLYSMSEKAVEVIEQVTREKRRDV